MFFFFIKVRRYDIGTYRYRYSADGTDTYVTYEGYGTGIVFDSHWEFDVK
jgi:hypothetical protein